MHLLHSPPRRLPSWPWRTWPLNSSPFRSFSDLIILTNVNNIHTFIKRNMWIVNKIRPKLFFILFCLTFVEGCITWFYVIGQRHRGQNMAATSKKVFEVFVSKIPWTVASSKLTKLFKFHSYMVAAWHASVASHFSLYIVLCCMQPPSRRLANGSRAVRNVIDRPSYRSLLESQKGTFHLDIHRG